MGYLQYCEGVLFKSLSCIHEMWFQPMHIFQFKFYNLVCLQHPSGLHREKCAIYKLDRICYYYILLDSSQQSVGITVTILGESYTIITYRTSTRSSTLLLGNITHFLHTPPIITGKFNSHDTYWGSNHTAIEGRILFDFIKIKNLVLLNDGSGTRLCDNGILSTLDPTLVSLVSSTARVCAVAPDKPYFLINNTFNSVASPPKLEHLDRWCSSRADWLTFYSLFSEQFYHVSIWW